VFWRVTFPQHELILFGYVRISAELVPETYSDGTRLISDTRSMLMDMNAAVNLPNSTFDKTQFQPVLDKLAPQSQEELRVVLANSLAPKVIEAMPGIVAGLFLSGEGGHSFGETKPSIGLALVRYAAGRGRQMALLVSDAEMLAMAKPMTADIFNSVGTRQSSICSSFVGASGRSAPILRSSTAHAEVQKLPGWARR
jgi:hypothetical protein